MRGRDVKPFCRPLGHEDEREAVDLENHLDVSRP